ncbi:hypothetical protein [Nonomuraea sp. NPDC002799]
MKRSFTMGVVAAFAVLSVAGPAVADDEPAAASFGGWRQPACESVTGDGSVTFTRNEGKTITPTSKVLEPIVYTNGVVALDRPGELLSMANNVLSTSRDSGCTWAPVAKVNGSNILLAAARGGRAYAWDRDGHVTLATSGGTTDLTSPAGELVGLGTDRLRGDHLRVADGDGRLLDSGDGGRTWRPIGVPAFPQSELLMVYTAVFDPYNLDHVVLGAAGHGARVTYDGGRTWRTSTGLTEDGGQINVFSAAVSPAAPNIVYVMGLNLAELDAGVPSGGRHIYRSLDGGRRFRPVVDQGGEVTLPNGPLLAAHPTDPGVLYFVFGTGWSGLGTNVYRYDARHDRVTANHNPYDRVTSIAFNPANSRVMYLGVAEEV